MEKRVVHVADAAAWKGEQVDKRLLTRVVGVHRDEGVKHFTLFARRFVARRHVVAWLLAEFTLLDACRLRKPANQCMLLQTIQHLIIRSN